MGLACASYVCVLYLQLMCVCLVICLLSLHQLSHRLCQSLGLSSAFPMVEQRYREARIAKLVDKARGEALLPSPHHLPLPSTSNL